MSPRKNAPKDAFAALADPTRRAILDLLRSRRTLNAGELAAEFPQISRAAVSKHLGILRGAKLVRARKQGREWHYELNPQPLIDVYLEWLLKFEELADESLEQLKKRVEHHVD